MTNLLSSKNIEKSPYIDSQKLSKGEFLRIEDKYLVEESLLPKILDELNQKMDPSYLDSDTQFTMIESLYFDSSNLDFFRHHFAKMPTRYKLRVRRYGPDGVWNNDSCLLELKRKSGGKCKKVRFKISATDLDNLKQGLALQDFQALYQINTETQESEILERFNLVNQLILEYQLRPVRAIRYKRFAFEKNDFRATIDMKIHQIEYIKLDQPFSDSIKAEEKTWTKVSNIIKKYGAGDKFILELKHKGVIPEWTSQMLEKNQIKQSSFSKYCYFTAIHLKRLSSL